MTSINDVRLVGKLTRAPEFHETASKKTYAKLTVETENFVRVNGERRRIAHVHTVICYNQFSLPVLRGVKAGQRVKVLGELAYDRNGNAEVRVLQYSGEVGLMDAPQEPGTQAPEPSKTEAPQTKAQPSGGLGRLPQSRHEADPQPEAAPVASQSSAPQYDPLDDEIPF